MGLLSSLASVGIGGPGLAGTYLTNQMQKREAEKQRVFQKQASDTAHQREVKDLRAAGLNPIISAGGSGASTPSGAQASLQDMGKSISSGISNAIARRKMVADVRYTTAQAKSSEVEASMNEDMHRFYGSNSAVKRATLAGMLGRKANVRGEFVAPMGAASAVQGRATKKAEGIMEGISDKWYKKMNRHVTGQSMLKKGRR